MGDSFLKWIALAVVAIFVFDWLRQGGTAGVTLNPSSSYPYNPGPLFASGPFISTQPQGYSFGGQYQTSMGNFNFNLSDY